MKNPASSTRRDFLFLSFFPDLPERTFMIDSYKTLAHESTGEFRDRGSRFIAYALSVYTDADKQSFLDRIKKEHPKARHHCYAYRFGTDGNDFRANDDGEPSGTAGRPILGQIDSFGLTNVMIVVVRYFGGTLLGTSGLINAYKNTAADALEKAETIEKFIEDIYEIRFDYALMGEVMNAVKKLELEITAQDFGLSGKLHVAIRKSEVEEILIQLKALIAKIPLEMAAREEETEGFSFKYKTTRG